MNSHAKAIGTGKVSKNTNLRVVELQRSFRFRRMLILLNVKNRVLEINSRPLGGAKHEANHTTAVEACQ